MKGAVRAYADRAGWKALGSGLGLAAGFLLLGFVLLVGFPLDFLGGFLALGLGAGLGSILVPALGHAVGEALTFAAIARIIGAVAGLIGSSSRGLFLTRVLRRVHE